jgi:hypothetical protein
VRVREVISVSSAFEVAEALMVTIVYGEVGQWRGGG